MGWLEWLRGIDLPPWGRALPPIARCAFECARCGSLCGGSLCGGIAGKGPWRRVRTGAAARCRHAWVELEYEAFVARVGAGGA